jgi:hypothetical protein
MEPFDWRPFLAACSAELLADPQVAASLPASVREAGWLGFDGASEAEIEAAEERLGTRLPPSYRAFLAASNGWRNVGGFIDRLWSSVDVDWFRARNRDWIDAYAGPMGEGDDLPDAAYFVYGPAQDPVRFRPRYLRTALEISDTGDSAILLLNPEVVTADGEWEAWFFANWLPGANRYRSFRELMEAERRNLAGLRMEDQATADRGPAGRVTGTSSSARPKPPSTLAILWREIRSAWRSSRSRGPDGDR